MGEVNLRRDEPTVKRQRRRNAKPNSLGQQREGRSAYRHGREATCIEVTPICRKHPCAET